MVFEKQNQDMNEYGHFGAEDFVWNEAFRRWVLVPTQEDLLFWESWQSENPHKAAVIAQARELVQAIGPRLEHLPESEKNRAIGEIIEHFDDRALSKVSSHTPLLRSFWFRAACLLLLLAGFATLFTRRNMRKQTGFEQLLAAGEVLKEVSNDAQKPIRITLQDGSSVTLDPGSRLSYPEHFTGSKRLVQLSGGAFFDIVKEPGRPFYVYAGKVVTKVLGTSFHVRSFNNEKEVSVSVKTGRVAVFTRDNDLSGDMAEISEQSGVVIEPNQQLIVAQKTTKITKTLVPNPEIVAAPEKIPSFNFEDYPVSEILKTLHAAYGIEIIFDENTMKNCPVTATLTDLSLYEKLDLVCNAVGASYEVIDGRIIVDGKGCQTK
jgi:transmembrane sensor